MKTYSLSIVLTAAVISGFFIEMPRAMGQTYPQSETAALISAGYISCINDVNAKKPPEQWSAKCLADIEKGSPARKDCKADNAEFQKSMGELRTSCGEAKLFLNLFSKGAGVPSEGRDDISNCIDNSDRCVHCEAGSEDIVGRSDLKCGVLSTTDDPDDLYKDNATGSGTQVLNSILTSATGMSTGASTESLKNKTRIQEEVLSCVQRSAVGLSELRTLGQATRKELRADEAELVEEQAKLAEINQAVTDKRNSAQDRAEEIQSKTMAAINDVKSRLDNRIQEAVSNWTQGNMNMETDLRRMERAKIQAGDVYTESILQLDRGCHANALARTEAVRKEMMDLIKQNAYTSGNFQALMNGVGNSNRKKYQAMANEYYSDCRGDRAYKSVVESSARAKKAAIDTANEEIAALKTRQQMARAELDQFKTAENTRALTEMQQMSTNMTKALAALDREIDAESKKSQQLLMTKSMKLNLLNRNISESRASYEEDQERIRLASRYTGSSTGIKEGAIEKATAAIDNTRARARSTEASCCFDSDPTVNEGCKSARSFLRKGQPSGSDPEPAAAAPAVGEVRSSEIIKK